MINFGLSLGAIAYYHLLLALLHSGPSDLPGFQLTRGSVLLLAVRTGFVFSYTVSSTLPVLLTCVLAFLPLFLSFQQIQFYSKFNHMCRDLLD